MMVELLYYACLLPAVEDPRRRAIVEKLIGQGFTLRQIVELLARMAIDHEKAAYGG